MKKANTRQRTIIALGVIIPMSILFYIGFFDDPIVEKETKQTSTPIINKEVKSTSTPEKIEKEVIEEKPIIKKEVIEKPVKKETKLDPVRAEKIVKRECLLCDKINMVRKENGLSELKISDELIQTTEFKTKEMYDSEYFAHENKTGEPFYKIFANFKVKAKMVGEILADTKTEKTPMQIVEAWLNSPTHKKVMLNPSYTAFNCSSFKNYHACHFIKR